MSYEAPDMQDYSWTDATFGATTVTHSFIGPRGKWGFVRDIYVDVATALVGTTTVPEVDVGFAAGDFTYGRYRLGSTAIAGYPVGFHRASIEAWTGNPPRIASDFPGHVVLDGGPYGSSPQNIIGGSTSTQQPLGRIPYSGRRVQSVIAGTSNAGNSTRIYLDDASGIAVGSLVQIQGIAGATATLAGTGSAGTLAMGTGLVTTGGLSNPPYGPGSYIEVQSSAPPGGAYTAGGQVHPIITVSNTAGVGGTPAGGGTVKVTVQWVGAVTP